MKPDITGFLYDALEAPLKLLTSAVALLGLWSAPTTISAELSALRPEPVEAQFRGCESAGWCRFSFESLDASLYRVRPDGVSVRGDEVRDRLNALLAGMIHQHKQVVLRDLRELQDGTYAARVIVNGADVALDSVLLELQHKLTGVNR